jgi:endonuclease/exonuclease/phosphatase family metal-dependent hydrolase
MMKVLSCNIRCFGGNDGDNGWPHRKDLCAQVIRSRDPDIICFQEMWGQQYEDLAAAFPEYSAQGMVDEPVGRHPQNCIFYRLQAFKRISAGGYWLSRTPHVPGSKSWDSDCVRLANWLRLADCATGAEFRVINTHLDHVSQLARENQARLIVEDASAYPAVYPQILTGDMNADYRNPALGIFKQGDWTDTYAAIHGTENPGDTYHGFLGPHHVPESGKIDWILTRGAVSVTGAEVIMDSLNGRYPSDHYFVAATVIAGKGDHGSR